MNTWHTGRSSGQHRAKEKITPGPHLGVHIPDGCVSLCIQKCPPLTGTKHLDASPVLLAHCAALPLLNCWQSSSGSTCLHSFPVTPLFLISLEREMMCARQVVFPRPRRQAKALSAQPLALPQLLQPQRCKGRAGGLLRVLPVHRSAGFRQFTSFNPLGGFAQLYLSSGVHRTSE